MCVSTKEHALAKQLYSTSDRCASQNIGRIMAKRMLDSGIVHATWTMPEHKKYHGKVFRDCYFIRRTTFESNVRWEHVIVFQVKEFIDAVRQGGVSLSETYDPKLN
jgi:hypothetical protein